MRSTTRVSQRLSNEDKPINSSSAYQIERYLNKNFFYISLQTNQEDCFVKTAKYHCNDNFNLKIVINPTRWNENDCQKIFDNSKERLKEIIKKFDKFLFDAQKKEFLFSTRNCDNMDALILSLKESGLIPAELLQQIEMHHKLKTPLTTDTEITSHDTQSELLARMANCKDASDSEHEYDDDESSSSEDEIVASQHDEQQHSEKKYHPSLITQAIYKVHGVTEKIASAVSPVGYYIEDKLEEKTGMKLRI